MTKLQRIRTCGNLLQLMEAARSVRVKEVYKKQYERQVRGLRKERFDWVVVKRKNDHVAAWP